MCGRRVADGEPESDRERVADEQDDVDDRGSDEDVAEELLPVEHVADPRSRVAEPHRPSLRELGHPSKGYRLHSSRFPDIFGALRSLVARSVRDAQVARPSLSAPTSYPCTP